MIFNERDKGIDQQDPLEKTSKIVELVLQVPHHAQDSGRVLDAVGCVLYDLKVLKNHQALMKQLGSGITTEDVDRAKESILQAAVLRPIDETATEERQIVLAGLHRIRLATEFNERVAKRPQNGTDGVTIFQAGISSDSVQQAITHVNEAKQLVENAPRPIKESESPLEIPLPDAELSTSPIQPEITTEESDKPKDIPVFSAPDDFNSIQAGKNAIVKQPKTSPVISKQDQSMQTRTLGLSRRNLLKLGGAAMGTLLLGEVSGLAPVVEWTVNLLDWHPKTLEQAESFMRLSSLSEVPITAGEWSAMYPTLESNEKFIDMFNDFKQVNGASNLIPIYAPVGENNPFPIFVTNASFMVDVYESKFTPSLVNVRGYDHLASGHPYIISGRKAPEDPTQRPYPNVIQIINAKTNSTFYLNVEPTKVEEKNAVEIRYMKRVKKSL